MELNETIIDDIKLNGELTKKPTICFQKMMVRKDIHTVGEKCENFKKRVNDIYENFEIWDGVSCIKPVLPKSPKKEKIEKIKKKNFILENMNKFKIPLFNMFIKSVGASSVNEKSEKTELSSYRTSLLHFKSNRKNEIKSHRNSKKLESHPSTNVLSKEKNKLLSTDGKKDSLNNFSFSVKQQQSNKKDMHNSNVEENKIASTFFITENNESKPKKPFSFKKILSNKKNNNYLNITENENKNNDKENKNNLLLKDKKDDSLMSKKPRNIKFLGLIAKERPTSMFGEKSLWPEIKEEGISTNPFYKIITNKEKKSKESNKSKKKFNSLAQKKIHFKEEKENEDVFLSSNGFVTTAEEQKNKTGLKIKNVSRDVYHMRNFTSKSSKKRSNDFYNHTQTIFSATHSKNKSELNMKNIRSHIHHLTDTNTKVNLEITEDKKFYDNINCDTREDYTKYEKEQLKDSIPQKSVVGEITIKGQKRYISKSRADIIRLSDSVIKLGPQNVYKFYNLLSEKYEECAKETDLSDYEYERKRNVLKLNSDNMNCNNMRMKCLVENIINIHSKHNKSSDKK